MEDLEARLRGDSHDCPVLGNGYVGMVNRSNRKALISLTDAADKEAAWFDAHLPSFRDEELAGGTVLLGKLVSSA